jgi:lysophospholipase L1-like esterase
MEHCRRISNRGSLGTFLQNMTGKDLKLLEEEGLKQRLSDLQSQLLVRTLFFYTFTHNDVTR